MIKDLKVLMLENKITYEECDIPFYISRKAIILDGEVKYVTETQYFSEDFGWFVDIEHYENEHDKTLPEKVIEKIEQRKSGLDKFVFSKEELEMLEIVHKYELLMSIAQEEGVYTIYESEGFKEAVHLFDFNAICRELKISLEDIKDEEKLRKAIRKYVFTKFKRFTQYNFVDFGEHSKNKIFLHTPNGRRYLRIKSLDNFEYDTIDRKFNVVYVLRKDEKTIAYERQFIVIRANHHNLEKVKKERKKILREYSKKVQFGQIIVNVLCDFDNVMILEKVLKF